MSYGKVTDYEGGVNKGVVMVGIGGRVERMEEKGREVGGLNGRKRDW